MEATIELYEPLHDHLKTVDRLGRRKAFKWVARFGPVVKICPSEKSAMNFLRNMGFTMNENFEWSLSRKSEGEKELEKNYREAL